MAPRHAREYRVGDWVKLHLRLHVLTVGVVVEDRGRLGPGGAQVVRVAAFLEPSDRAEFDIAASELQRVSSGTFLSMYFDEERSPTDGRPAAFAYHVDVYNKSGTRFPVRIMTEDVAILSVQSQLESGGQENELPSAIREVYEDVLIELLLGDRLRPSNALKGKLNFVYLVTDRHGAKANDILIDDAESRIWGALREKSEARGRSQADAHAR